MGSLFGGSKTPAPAPVPVAPTTDAEAERKRKEAADQAVAERSAAGRRSTNVGGARAALESRVGDKATTLG